MGVVHPAPVAPRPVAERPVDVLFNGSLRTRARGSLRDLVGTPRSRSRAAMPARVRELQAADPGVRVELLVLPSFAASKQAGPEAYWRTLSDAKICLVPRGDTLETYRLFEAARAGCVLVAEKLPPAWFYDGAPVVDMTGWRDLVAGVRALLADPAALAARQRHTLAWWEERVSPAAVGRHMAGVVRTALDA